MTTASLPCLLDHAGNRAVSLDMIRTFAVLF